MRSAIAVRLCVLGLLACVPHLARATTVALGTNNGNFTSWKITGAGATNATAEQYGGGPTAAISITDNNLSSGTFITGGSAANFDGYFVATNTFNIPSDATGISLAWNFIEAGSDDRAVVELNGHILGDYFLSTNTFADPPITGPGTFAFTDGPPANDVAYTFTGTTSGTVINPAFFNVGGSNALTLIVNNVVSGSSPDNNPFAATTGFEFSSDGTYVNQNAILTYTETAVPLPAAAWSGLALLGGLAVLTATRSRRGVALSV